MTIQTAFRLEESIIELMKKRAKLKRQSVNSYVAELISNDLRNNSMLPSVEIPSELDEDILLFAGSMRRPIDSELESDEKLARIWQR